MKKNKIKSLLNSKSNETNETNDYQMVNGKMKLTTETIEKIRELSLKYNLKYETVRSYLKTYSTIKKIDEVLLKNKMRDTSSNVRRMVWIEINELERLEKIGRQQKLVMFNFPTNFQLPSIPLPNDLVEELMMDYREYILCWNDCIEKGIVKQTDVYTPKKCKEKVNKYLEQKYDGIDIYELCNVLSKLKFPKTISKTMKEIEYEYLSKQLRWRFDELCK